ncbi:MAG: DUF4388 domain-containing protein [Deltaproteobacteria bacterium]
MAISGDIDTMALADLLQWVELSRKTGCLEVKWQHEWNVMEKRIYFQDGIIVFASSNKQEEKLGEYLISKKLISKENFEKCLKEGKEKNKLMTDVMQANDLVSKEQLTNVMTELAENIIYDLFRWETGTFAFTTHPVPEPILQAEIQLKGQGIIMEAIRRLDEEKKDGPMEEAEVLDDIIF